jgi:acetyl esterase/lipase
MYNIQRIAPSIALLLLASGCGKDAAPLGKSLAEARRGFATKPGGVQPAREGLPQPPPDVFQLVKYPSPVGELSAYLAPDPGDGEKHPAIVWITGGDCNSIGDVWEPAPRENDQTAAAYRKAGIVMMFPSLRGGNDNPGRREGFLGEVDDVLAAAEYLAAQPYVDPGRIYLGGHSTGGTLVMLAAEMSDRFRAVFAFGPVGDVRSYGGEFVYHQPGDPTESMLRSPGYWLDSVRSALFVIEGTGGNIDALREMQAKSTNPLVRFVTVTGVDHFGILTPANAAIAEEIVADVSPTMGINLSEQKLKGSGR